jgi:PIN domain nuclease of toxin-antitoxin system
MTSAEAPPVLVLDTHLWVWYAEGDRGRFSPRVEALVEAAVERGGVVISAISVWEVAQLSASRRLELSMDVRSWVNRALNFPGLRLKGLTPAIAIESTRLPGEPHRDPADRMIIATTRLVGASLVTCDERIIEYAGRGHVRAVDARP